MAHPVIISTEGPVLLRLAAGRRLVLHNPGTTHSCTPLLKGSLPILCLPAGKRGKVKARFSEQLSRKQKHKAVVLTQLVGGNDSHLVSITSNIYCKILYCLFSQNKALHLLKLMFSCRELVTLRIYYDSIIPQKYFVLCVNIKLA